MKLYDAMRVGSKILKSVPFTVNDGHGGGCILGMAEVGADVKYVVTAWKWLNQPAVAPCGCQIYKQYFPAEIWTGPIQTFDEVIAHVFNEHVHGDNTWTFEKLINYVRSVEPEEHHLVENVGTIEQQTEHICVAGVGFS